MIPDSVFLQLATKFFRPSPTELEQLKHEQRERFQQGEHLALIEVALKTGVLAQRDVDAFVAAAGGGSADAPSAPPRVPSDRVRVPSGRSKTPGEKAPSDRVRVPSGRSKTPGVKAPSDRVKARTRSKPSDRVKAPTRSKPSDRVKAPSDRARAGKASERARASASGKHPQPQGPPWGLIAAGAVVLVCLGGAVAIGLGGPSETTPTAATTDPDPDATTPKQPSYLERARALRGASFARLDTGQGERALSDLDALRYEWSDVPEAAEACLALEELRADLVAEIARRRGRFADEDEDEDEGPSVPPPLTRFDEVDEDPSEEDDPPAPPPAKVPEDQPPALPPQPKLPPPPEVPQPSADPQPAPDPGPVDPKPTVDPDPSTDPGPATTTDPAPAFPPGFTPSNAYSHAWNAYAKVDTPLLRQRCEELVQADDPMAPAARGLLSFREGHFPVAWDQLGTAVRVHPNTRNVWLRCGLFLGRFAEVREEILAHPDDVDPELRVLILGPFHAAYPLASAALERITPDARYRVVTNVGLSPRTLAQLEAKLTAADPDERAGLVARARKKHVGLQRLADTMDKAYAAYDKLFAIDRACELVPTVYLFADGAEFAEFCGKLEIGEPESALGFYLPHYRVLLFYEQNPTQPGQLSLETQETLMHETCHQWVHLYVRDAPTWFDEGLAEYFGHCRFEGSRLRYGLVPPLVGATRLANIRDALSGDGLSPPWTVKRLLLADYDAFHTTHEAVNYAQAWSFVHYLASSKQGAKRLRAYFGGLREDASAEGLFRRVFGDVNPDDLDEAWKDYVRRLRPS